jgi:hypothetical protein
MGLITERSMERLSFGSRLLKRSLTPYEFFTPKGPRKLTPRKLTQRELSQVRQDFLRGIVLQLVARRKELDMSGPDVDARIGCAEALVAKWECGIRGPSAFNLLNWAEALGCQWVLVPVSTPTKEDGCDAS